jgi:AcrR family transcriptional regulator
VDARQRRSRDRLHRAVLELAGEAPVAELSVTAVADAAGVHRSTFYEHAASPGDLLRAALTAELDELRERYLADPGAGPEAVAAVTEAVIQHVSSYAVVYRRGLAPDAGPGSLVTTLAEHFLASGRLLQERDIGRGPRVPGLSAEVAAEAAAGFVAFGTVGAIRAWLEQPEPRDPATFAALDAALLPPWWLGSSTT